MTIAYIGIGSNLGNRVENLRSALELIDGIMTLDQLSGTYETAPKYVLDQPAFLNMAIGGETLCDPLPLLEKLKSRCINGCLTVIATKERSQFQNRQLALARLANLVREGLKPPPKSRKATKPTRASQKRRIASKKHRSALKQARQRKASTDD